MSLNSPQNLSDYGTAVGAFLAFCGAVVAIIKFFFVRPFQIFETVKHADQTYLKKTEENGHALWVHADDWDGMKKKIDESVEESRKWRDLAERWMKNP